MQNSLTPIQRLWKLFKPDTEEIKNIYIYSAFSGLVGLSLPLGLQAITNLIQGGWISASWVVLVLFVIGGIVIMGIIYVAQLRIIENLQQKVFARTAMEFAYRFPRVYTEVFLKYYPPDLANRFFDVISIQKSLSKILIDISFVFFSIFFSLILLSLYHPFFLLYFLFLIILYALLKMTYVKGMETSLKTSKYKYKTAAWLEEVAHAFMTFKLAGNSNFPLEKTDKCVGNYIDAREKHFKVIVSQSIMLIVFKVLVVAGFLVIGGILVMEQEMNIGQFVASEVIVLLIMGSIEKLIFSLNAIYSMLTALEKIGFVTDLPLEEEPQNALTIPNNSKGLSVEIENINFKYPDVIYPALKNITLKIKSGERVLITGSEGAGKTTLLRIIAGLYHDFDGNIIYNGQPLRSLSINYIRSITGDFMNKDIPFEGTILENITLGRKNITIEDVEWATENVGLHEFIRKLPEGYNTVLIPQEQRLSESFILKLMLARSIVHKPKLLVLDNALEHLPNYSYKKIIDFLTDEKRPWTLVAASYKNYFAEKTDTIIIMDKGEIIAQGNYNDIKQLLKKYTH